MHEALDQRSTLVAIQVAVVVVQVVEVRRLLILRLVVSSLDAPDVRPVRRRRMVRAEQIVRTRNPLVEIFLDQPARNDARFHDAAQALVARPM